MLFLKNNPYSCSTELAILLSIGVGNVIKITLLQARQAEMAKTQTEAEKQTEVMTMMMMIMMMIMMIMIMMMIMMMMIMMTKLCR